MHAVILSTYCLGMKVANCSEIFNLLRLGIFDYISFSGQKKNKKKHGYVEGAFSREAVCHIFNNALHNLNIFLSLVRYKLCFFQMVTAICVGLVADNWNVAMTPSKIAVVNGTLVGYIMLSIVIILGIVLDIPLDRTLVRTGYVFVINNTCMCT
jgi:hypothetical protein